ncbi:MAG: hypothetical protein IJW06_05555 [Clostridia bacterium]|nr:hypothetical protein [Clostridia bacterium]
MNTKKKRTISIWVAVYGLASPIFSLVFAAANSPYGWDTVVPDELITSVVIDLIIGIAGVIAAVYYSRKLVAEKVEQLSQVSSSLNVCRNCKANLLQGTTICPRCGTKME